MIKNLRPVALVADRIDHHDTASIGDRTLEQVEDRYFSDVVGALEAMGRGIAHLDSPKSLMAAADDLTNHIVIPLWSGKNSRSRRALIASICESAGLSYIGADPYTAIVCQDKILSKDFARRYGFVAPESIVVELKDEPPTSTALRAPFVVKPVFEGGSIGINQDSLCHTWADVIAQTSRLKTSLGAPVMIEEFVEGEEVSICLMGGSNAETRRLAAVRLEVDGFDVVHNVWSMEIKKSRAYARRNIPITDMLPQAVLEASHALFEAFEKIDFLRIDCRVREESYQLIELTPDVHLGSTASFAQAMASTGLDYDEMWQHLIALGE